MITTATPAAPAVPAVPATSSRRPWTAAATVVTVAAALAYAIGAARGEATLAGVVLVPVLVAAAVPLVRRLDAGVSFDLSGMLLCGFAAKLLATYFRFRAGSDSIVYDEVGRDLAVHFRHLDFTVDTGRPIPGTGSIRYLTGLVHVLTGSDYLATTLVFSTIGFLGLAFFVRAALVVGGTVDVPRYAALVLLWPSLLYWPSSIGKEAVMVFCLGVCALGAARLLMRVRSGLAVLGVGLAGAAMVRPHVALIVVGAVTAALVVRAPIPGGRRAVVAKVLGVGVLVVAAMLLAGATEETLKVDNLSGAGSLTEALDRTELQTSQGGAGFRAARVTSPADYPWAFVTVLFRPFPTEAHSGEAIFSALESIGLLALGAASTGRMLRCARDLRSAPYACFAFVYLLTFVYLFSAIGNFGILTRQRVQLLPLLFVPLALPSGSPAPVARRLAVPPRAVQKVMS